MDEREIYNESDSRETEENLEALRRVLEDISADNELLLEAIRRGDERELYEISGLLAARVGGWLGGSGKIWCALQNNPKLVSVSDTDQCTTCGRRFWKQRRLSYCTYCPSTKL